MLHRHLHIIAATTWLGLVLAPSHAESNEVMFPCLVTGTAALETIDGNASQLSGIRGSFRKGDFIDLKLALNPNTQTLQAETLFSGMPEFYFPEAVIALNDDASNPDDVPADADLRPISVAASGLPGRLILNEYFNDDWQGLIIAREFSETSETGFIATLNCFNAGAMIRQINRQFQALKASSNQTNSESSISTESSD